MGSYILERLLLLIPKILGITAISFLIIQLAPGDPAELRVGTALEGAAIDPTKQRINQQIIEETRRLYKLDRPLYIQYLNWLGQVVTLDFGDSFQDHRPVLEKIKERVPVTVMLSMTSLFIAYMVALPMGVFSAVRRYSLMDQVTTFLFFVLYSLPSFWVATMAIVFLCGGDFWSWFPPAGLTSINFSEDWNFWYRLWDRSWHLFLPVGCFTYGGFAFLSRQMRSSMLEVIRQDYIRTAQAKGLVERVVIFKHALRNALIPILTLLANLLPALVGGSIIIEVIFSIPGMGLLSWNAILARDYPVIMAVFTISSFLTLLGLLLSDILYVLVDPRITFSQKAQ